jgi:hypothetical protein
MITNIVIPSKRKAVREIPHGFQMKMPWAASICPRLLDSLADVSSLSRTGRPWRQSNKSKNKTLFQPSSPGHPLTKVKHYLLQEKENVNPLIEKN